MLDSGMGTGGTWQQGISAATAAIQGLAGGNVAQALSGAARRVRMWRRRYTI